jgi:outer membrane protein OmpA-like peptidoglycan-associated protein
MIKKLKSIIEMKKLNFLAALFLVGAILLDGCSSSQWATTSNKTKGGVIGGTGGAMLGSGIGALAGKGKGAAIGAAIGAAVGTGAGMLIGNKMDKQRAELEQIEGAQVESVTDINNLQAIKVTFDSGILFETGKSNLNAPSRDALVRFANSLRANPETDVTIYGHTDNTGSRAINEKLSDERAESVAKFLIENGINGSRLATEGKAYDEPVADNSTPEGRALNRRVEIYITANEAMIQQAEAGTLR